MMTNTNISITFSGVFDGIHYHPLTFVLCNAIQQGSLINFPYKKVCEKFQGNGQVQFFFPDFAKKISFIQINRVAATIIIVV